MSQQIYNFIKFLEKKEGRTPPPSVLIRYGTDEQKNDEAIQLAAVESDGSIIKFINNPTEAVQLAAVKKDGSSIEYIYEKGIEPSEDIQIAAIKQNIKTIDFIDMSKPSIKKAAYDKLMSHYGGRIPIWRKSYFD